MYRRLGGGEYRAGRSLDALQSAYRIGARVAWRELSDTAAAAGASPRTQRNLAEAMFAYIDRIAGESVEGYAAAQLQRRRRPRPAPGGARRGAPSGVARTTGARRAAEPASWPLPRTVACLRRRRRAREGPERLLSGETLGVRLGETTGIVVPHPVSLEREAARLAERLQLTAWPSGRRWRRGRCAASMQLAARALELAEPAAPPVRRRAAARRRSRCAPRRRSRALRRRLLAPLDGQTPASGERLEATLLEWLRHRGSQSAIAAELGVHPQTVRYRMARLRDLMGETLDDPEQRFALEMALRGGG